MEKKSFADAVRGYSCSWEEGSPGEPVINRNFSFKYHSITGTNAHLKWRQRREVLLKSPINLEKGKNKSLICKKIIL